MKTHIFYIAITAAAAVILTATTAQAQYAVPPAISMQPSNATYAKKATARFYINASSIDGGYLTYKWYCSGPFSTPFTHPNGTNKDQIINHKTKVSVGTSATLTTTTSTQNGYYYYWVEITNHKDGAVAAIKSSIVEAKVVDRTLFDAIRNGDFEAYTTRDRSDFYNPLYSIRGVTSYNSDYKKYTFETGDPIARGKYAPVTTYPQYLPSKGFWNTTHFYSDRGSEYKGIETMPGVHYMNGKSVPWSRDKSTPPYYSGRTQNESIVAELGAHTPSSIFQEVATVPGKIYEWSLDHGARANSPEVTAVIIGAAINEPNDYTARGIPNRWIKENRLNYNIPSADKQELQTYAYGQNLATFFSDIANKLSKDMKMSNLTAFIGQSGRQDGSTSPLANKVYTTTYGGKQYYLYISSSLTTQDFQHRSGVYTVPAGQGTTIFSFAAITSNAGAGNLLDNIIFRSGSSITSDQKISITNEVQLSASTKPNYAYGIVEIRGSSPIHAGNVKTYYDPDGARGSASEAPISENTSLGLYGWYTGNFTAKGVIIFKNLVPGKTYRIIGIPVAAINPDLHTNESPMYVLDEGYYKNTKIQPTNAGDDKTVWNINLEIYQDDKAKKKVRIGVENARSDVEYALLAGSAAAPNTGAPAHAWTAWKLGAAGNVSFDNLLLDTCYFLIVRPAGYTEMSYADAAYDENKKPAYIKIKTPRQIDIPTIAPSNVARPTGAMISIANTQAHYEYAVIDPETGAIVGAPQSGNNGKLSFVNLDHTKTYRVMVKSKLFNIPWMRVVHVYPYAGPFSIDYYGEAIKSAAGGGNIPDNVEYQIIANDGSNTGIAGGGDVWVSGTGNQPIDLAALILNNGNKSILDSLETLGVSAMLGYRIRPGSDGYAGGSISPIASLAIPKRRTPPASPADYSFDYANEQITTPSIALDFAAIGATTWTSVASGNAWTFTAAGWGVGSMACKFHVRYPATANTFASSSHHTDEIPARPAAPALKIWPVLDSIIISGLKDGTKYEYMRGNGSWSTLKHANGSSPALQFADGDVYYVRLAATANSPASFSVTISLPLGIQSLAFSRYSYQTPPVEQAVNIINIIDAAIDSVTVTLAGANASSFVLTTPENKTIAAHSTNTSWKLKPKDNLDVGTYTAILKMKYKYRALLHEDSAGVHLQVSKSNWNTGMIKGSFDVSATKAERLTLKIANAPQGALLRYYFGLTPVAGNPSDVVPADGKVTRVFTAANGLRPQTTYVLSITAAADKNHNESNRIVLAVGYTACATPVFNNVVRVNYVDEQLELNTGYLPEDYSVICLDATGGAAVAAVAIQEPAYSIAVPVENMSSFKLGLACREKPPYPASDTAYSVAITGRGAAPTGVTTKPQTNMQVSNGKIFLPGVFEYCIRGSSSWNSAKDSVTVQSGNYNVRFPATPTAFASKSTLVRVAGICYVTFNSNGGTFIDQQAVPDGSRATNPSPNPTRLGYNFKGWYTDNNTFANSWNFTTPLDHDTTLHAKWEVISYKITYKNIAGIVSKPTYATYTIASSVALQDVEKAGYKFAGWYVDSLASPTRVTEIARGSTGDVTFWARWKKLYTVAFNVNGGSGAIPSCSIAVGDMAI
ncbi:MAG: InlB B-repeat-containing protein, partial [Prevotellaceae bacterium]|nr:InlB B-repeat-containing protein [Prevotellaceae bacterium]